MSTKRQREAPQGGSRGKLWAPILGVAVVAVLAVAALVLLGRPSQQPSPPVTFEPPPFASGTTKGKASAPVTIIEYSDFQ